MSRIRIRLAYQPRPTPGLNQPLTVLTIDQSLIVNICQPDDDRLPATAAVDLDFVGLHLYSRTQESCRWAARTFLKVLSVHRSPMRQKRTASAGPRHKSCHVAGQRAPKGSLAVNNCLEYAISRPI